MVRSIGLSRPTLAWALALGLVGACGDDVSSTGGESSSSSPSTAVLTSSGQASASASASASAMATMPNVTTKEMGSTSASTSTSSTGDSKPGGAPIDPRIKHLVQGGNTQTTVDATSKTQWVFLDLDASIAWNATYSEGVQNPEWDLAIQRSDLKLNGGVNGSAGVSALWVEGAAAFEEMKFVPSGEFKMDETGTGTGPGQKGFVFGDWYSYNPQTHQLSPKARVYVVKSSQNLYFKVKILDFYGPGGVAGHLKFLWSKLEPDSSTDTSTGDSSGSDTSTGEPEYADHPQDYRVNHLQEHRDIETWVQAISSDDWFYLDLDKIYDDNTELGASIPFPGWDVGIQRYNFKLNGGANGTQGVVATVVEGKDAYAQTLIAPEGEYGTDKAPDPTKRDPGYYFKDWYQYDFSTHVLTPQARVYVVKSTENKAYKIQVLDYYNRRGGEPVSGYPQFRWDRLPLSF